MDADERKRLQKLMLFEKDARKKGFKLIAGIDEAGRGCLAGPVVAAACLLPANLLIPGIDDSKQLTSKQRDELFQILTGNKKIKYGVGIICHETIDRVNILQATIAAMLQAVDSLPIIPDFLLVDGLKLPHPFIESQKIIGGDALSQSIAAASIIAKVTRDRLMLKFHEEWPHYEFNKNKGYGTERHINAINQYGACSIHRMTFDPLRSLLLDTSIEVNILSGNF